MRNHMFISLVCLCLLSACGAKSGTKITDEQIQKLHPGQTTYTEAVQILGPPNHQMILSDGKRVLTWVYVEMTTRPETFIPFAGAFVGGGNSKSSGLTLSFDKDGKLQDTTSSSSSSSSRLMGGNSSTTSTTQVNPTP